MTNDRHFTTRRGFVGAMGFGALGLYATWAAYGASPFFFAFGGSAAEPETHGGLGGHADPAVGEAHEAARMSSADFEKLHADFVKAHRQTDGSVRPLAATNHDAAPPEARAGHDAPVMDHAHAGHDTAMPTSPAGHDAPMAEDHAGHGAARLPGSVDPHAHDDHATHAPVPSVTPASAGHDGHDQHAAMPAPMPSVASASAHETADAPIEVYLSAGRFAFEPDDLRLEKGRTYRFHMMATDVAHGASIAFGRASRIVRLRPDTVTTLDLTFRETGRHLVYCTVYCGLGHDAMHASITVA